MDIPSKIPGDLRRPKDFLNSTRLPILVSRPSSSSSSSLSREHTGSPVVAMHQDISNTISQDLGDVANLEALGFVAQAVDQEILEKEIAAKADQVITSREDELEEKRLERSKSEKEKLVYSLGRVKEKLNHSRTKISEKQELRVQVQELQKKIDGLDQDIADINARTHARRSRVAELLAAPVLAAAERLPTESEREFLIRTGKITPFAQIPGVERSNLNIGKDMGESISKLPMEISAKMSHQNLRKPGFQQDMSLEEPESSEEEGEVTPPNKRRCLVKGPEADTIEVESEESESISSSSSKKRQRCKATSDSEDENYSPEPPPKINKTHRKRKLANSEDDFTATEVTSEDGDDSDYFIGKGAMKSKKRKGRGVKAPETDDLRKLDDGNEISYQERLKEWGDSRRKARNQKKVPREGSNKGSDSDSELEECYMPHPTEADTVFSGGFKVPGDIFPSLFDYQKICVQWLWELHAQDAGGIIGDEMGLGKTIQIISFIAGLHHSNMLKKPVIVVAPATVLKQWANEFHLWWPPLRVSILHSSGSGMLNVKQEEDYDDLLDRERVASGSKSSMGAKKIVSKVFEKGHVLVTTYAGLKTYGDLLLNKDWEYAILDEGHKIRNPNAEISLSCKKLKTRHRIILSGTPLQNNLTELWSLFDFVFPGRLGTLPIFQSQFAIPIKMGGYANASNVQVQTAYKCAVVLRELISPYLLRRLKVDVAADLPKKSEQVLFCKLTKYQRDEYEKFLKSKECRQILDGKLNSLFGIDVLRKICNHPDLVDRDVLMHKKGYGYGKGAYSGKMQITKSLLQLWKRQGHRTLLFTQTRQMLDILEGFIKNFGEEETFKYRRMDGNTAIQHRQGLVDEFNKDLSIDVFLLTTKVGGLGVNLTGADRVIIFDPDWNPSTDMQARERAWRLGQKKSVTVYRLLTAGTIEEKIYHRQIFKQHLALKILSDPNQRRFFKMDDMHDLFKLGGSTVTGTETGNMFQGAEKVYDDGTSLGPVIEVRGNDDDPTELRKIAGVAGLENFLDNGGEQKIADKDKSDEMRFMEDIFGGSGVLSALEHDTVMNASHTHTTVTEKEATKVAEAAAKALRESIKATQAASIGTVTWTGKFGSAGKGKEDIPVVPTAVGLLATLRRRNNNSGGGTSSKTNLRVGSRNASVKPIAVRCPLPQQPGENGLIVRLREYMKDKGGNATSGEISEFAKGMIQAGDKQQMDEFRYMLREIAVLKKEERVWSLKKEYL